MIVERAVAEVKLIPLIASVALLVDGALKSPIRLFASVTVIPPETRMPFTVPVALFDCKFPILFFNTD